MKQPQIQLMLELKTVSQTNWFIYEIITELEKCLDNMSKCLAVT